ncbi:MAG: porin family protein [Methylobacter sp.]|uniref:porin family protein n=1 Tax=Methylobacter sp. TaxID=2051955 RepID=UPI002590BC34|nr:porin family protein [Methylobacter sp.]MCL7420303.1 porin family protein [Methylobacter sp.]
MTFTKTKLALGIASATLTMAGALISPQAAAHSKAERVAEAANSRAEALEAQMQQMSQMMQSMQAELNRVKAEAARPAADSEKVQELDQWMATVKSEPVKAKSKDNMVFFRGGYGRNDHKRDGVSIYSDVAGSQLGLPGQNGDNEAWYMGAGFDFSVNDNLFGLMDNTEVLAELMFDWKEFSSATQGNVLAQDPTFLATGQMVPTREVSVSQFTISAAPKIKFMKGSNFRPWVIPVGMAFHVISPPSESITVFNPGMMFGAGADYKIWKDIYVGTDARYHLTGRNGDGVNTDGFTAGGYIGLGF